MKTVTFFNTLRKKVASIFVAFASLICINLLMIYSSDQEVRYMDFVLNKAQQLNELTRSLVQEQATQLEQERFNALLKAFMYSEKTNAKDPYPIRKLPEEAAFYLNALYQRWGQYQSLQDNRQQADAQMHITTDEQFTELSQAFYQRLRTQQLQTQQEHNKLLLYVLMFDIVILLICFLILSRIYFRKTAEMHHYASQISKGKFEHSIAVQTNDELGYMTQVIRQLVEHIENASSFVRQMGEGKLDIQLQKSSQLDEQVNSLPQALLNMQHKMLTVAESDRQHNWATQGLAQFVEILRNSSQQVEELADIIISQLVSYLKANQGALYLIEGEEYEEQKLVLKALYAFDRKKYTQKSIKLGEGLIGQSVKEQTTYYLTDIPQGYIQITSGLGEANPNALLIVPLKVNDEVQGAVEIASFEPFETYQVEFVEKLAESIASTLKNVKVSEQTKELLLESQRQAEALQAQEEELRQNMEELHTTQEDMKLKEIELEGQLRAVNHTLSTVELNMQGQILEVNAHLLDELSYSKEALVGKELRKLFDVSDKRKYSKLWDKLQQGRSVIIESKLYSAQGNEHWYTCSFTPVVNDEGVAVKILVLAIDITEEKKISLDFQGQVEAINLSSAVAEFDPEGMIKNVNADFLQLMGYDADELLGKHHSIMLPESESETTMDQRMWKQLSHGQYFKQEVQRRKKDGECLWIHACYCPVKNAEGQVTKVLLMATDISARKQLEDEVQEQMHQMMAQEEELRQSMEEMTATQEELERRMKESENYQHELYARMGALDDFALLTESDLFGNITFANQKFLEVSKYTEEEVLGKPHNILRHPDTPKEVFKDMWQTIKAGKIFRGTYANRAKDNSTYWVDATIVPVLNEEGKPQKYIGIRVEVTENVHMQQQIELQLAKINQQKEEMTQQVEQLTSTQELLADSLEKKQQQEFELQARLKALDHTALITESDVYGNINYINNKFCEVAKYTEKEVLGKPHNILRHPEVPKDVFRQMWETIKSGQVFKATYPNKAKDDSTYWVHATIVPVMDENGKPVKYIGIRQQLFEQEQKEIRVHQSLDLVYEEAQTKPLSMN